jgi:ABC-type uncharacterized transport system ATPase subunit
MEIRKVASAFARTEQGFEVQAGSLEAANTIIDHIRAAGGLVQSFNASSSSLEDVFIAITRPQQENAA